MLPGLHHSGGTVCEPVDLPVTKRHRKCCAILRLFDKPIQDGTAPELGGCYGPADYGIFAAESFGGRGV